MKISFFYCKWFQKIMSFFAEGFFIAAPLASLFVFTSFLNGTLRWIAFVVLIVLYLTIIYFFKDKIRGIISIFLQKTDQVGFLKMILVFSLILLTEKIIYTALFNYDATASGDIKIYSDIANQIISTGNLHSDAISHLYGLALHFVVIRLMGLPLHIGLFLAFYIGVLVNFVSFSDLLGKNKTFLLVILYILMPSSVLMTFSPTHEVFVFMYISLFLFLFNRMIKAEKTVMAIVLGVLMTLCTILTCFVNPGGYIIYIIMLLCILLSNIRWEKKAIIAISLVMAILASGWISDYLQVNEYSTTINTYTILIHGVNPDSLGEQVDGYPLRQMRYYIYDNTLDFSPEGFVDAAKHVLINHYKYLLTHPFVLIRLIIHKIYILWSGVHYPIELAHYYGALNDFTYYAFLVISTLIYLFVLTLGNVYRSNKKEGDDISYSNYVLELLGVIALTLLCIVVNKYSLYVTMFVYLIAFYRAELEKND